MARLLPFRADIIAGREQPVREILCLKEESVTDFYDQLSPFYHLIYEDWDASIAWQAERLSRIIRAQWGEHVTSVPDVSCGIGTQALGLARLGFQVTASDLSPAAIARAQKEATARHLRIPFSVCDMREAFRHHGGGCLLTIRAYDKEARGRGIVKPYGIREDGRKRFLIFQVWDFEGEQYALSMYFVEDDMQSGGAATHVMRSRYYAISPHHLLELMEQGGFVEVRRLDEVFYQPVLVGTRKA
jgi:SAM-dependent methyltransferase